MAPFKRRFKRGARRVGKAIKRRYVKRGKLNTGQVVRDVRFLKSVLNPELKEFNVYNDPASDDAIDVGQVSGNVAGYYVADVSCIPAQGSTSITRNGNSIRLKAMHNKFLVFQQASAVAPVSGKIMYFLVRGPPITNLSASIDKWFEPNRFLNVSVVDGNSHFDPDYKHQYKLLGTRYFKVGSDTVTSAEMGHSFSHSIYFKNQHVRFESDGSQTIASGQIIMLVLTTSGNAANSTASTAKNIMPSGGGTQSGITFNYNSKYTFYDN